MAGMRMRAGLAAAVTAGALVVMPAGRAATNPFPKCSAPPARGTAMPVAVGTVACQELTTTTLGPGIPAPFEYYVPPGCAPALHVRCPVLYLLHGFGGDYTEMLGQPGTATSAWVASLTHRPPAGFESSPWTNADPSKWPAAPALGIILVAPHGQTLPGGYGPSPGQDSYWVDWNPRYAKGGDAPRYATPAPRFSTFLAHELPDFVEQQLPAGRGRAWRALAGVSLGGYGSYANGLQHPDEWAAIMSVSGAHNFLFAPAPQPGAVTLPVGITSPVPVAYTHLPSVTGLVPTASAPSQVGTFLTALDALGDPVADQAYFRGNMPPDLAINARAYARGSQILGIDGFVNDTVPRQAGDLPDMPFEDIVLPMNLEMQTAFTQQAVTDTFAIHQGVHSDPYRNAWLRGLEEFADARLDQPGTPAPPAVGPSTFDYRTISRGFRIWGWQFAVDRQTVEFLTLRNVSCKSVTLQGSGTITVTIPAGCHAAVRTVTVHLGNPGPLDDPAALGATPVYGNTVTVSLR